MKIKRRARASSTTFSDIKQCKSRVLFKKSLVFSFMIDIPLFCFSVYMSTFAYSNGIRLLRALLGIFIAVLVKWPEKEDVKIAEKAELLEKQSENTRTWKWICK